jgi:hypothetical protein
MKVITAVLVDIQVFSNVTRFRQAAINSGDGITSQKTWIFDNFYRKKWNNKNITT